MPFIAGALSLIGVALFAGALHMAGVGQLPGGAPAIVGALLLDAGPFSKLALLLVVANLIMSVVTGALMSGRRQAVAKGHPLQLATLGLPAFATLLALYETMNIRRAMAATGVTNIMVIAPSVAETLLVASLGFLAAALSAWVCVVLAARARA